MIKALLNLTKISEENTNIISEKEIYTIESATPLSIGCKGVSAGDVVTNYWLCKLTNDNLIILCCNYLVESEEEKSSLVKSVPYHEDKAFMNHNIFRNMLLSKIPVYITDFLFYESEGGKIEISSKLLSLNDNETEEVIVHFNFSLDIFASFAYIENYITECIFNYHDISLATLSGVNISDTETILYNVSDVDILSVVNIDKKKNSIGVLLRTISKDKDEKSYNILIPFESDIKVNKKKSKGTTIYQIQENYLSDEDEYISLFMFETRIEDVEKDYLFIKAKNKNEKSIIFTLDSAARQILVNKVTDF